ncbi:MAG TPA: hypothetical protein VMP01_01070 [Pirellulaceae bacterium]|nr:hypothetical protein [Pirellulaceae bacterium]
MHRRPLLRFLVSVEAIQVHLACLALIALLSYSLWTGDAQPDYGWGLLFTVVAYPVILGLMWWSERLEEKEQIEHAIASVMDADGLRRRRRFWRRGALAVLAVVAAGFIYAGFEGLRVDFLPAQYLGYLLMAFTVAGAAGINIWYGGPLDPRRDPPPAGPYEET